jgi:uncharacterized protein
VTEVEVELDACAYQLAPGHRLRLSVAGADWPNTVAPTAPVTLTFRDGAVELPLWQGDDRRAPTFTPGDSSSSEDPGDVVWSVTDDVLRRTTTCTVRSGSSYEVPHGGRASEEYAGDVVVDRRTFTQHASADCTYQLQWPEVDVRVTSTMAVALAADGLDVAIEVTAFEGGEQVAHRTWSERPW